MDYKTEISKYYSEWWENPRDIRTVVFEDLNELIRRRLPKGEGRKALDIGAGKGRIVNYLLEKGYEVTAVELNKEFADKLREKFPTIKVIQGDICKLKLNEHFRLTTMIEVAQNLRQRDLSEILRKLAKITNHLFINISNKNSLHGKWVKFRHFKKEFVFMYTPTDIESMLRNTGFSVVYGKGVGLVTPISLFHNFKGILIPIWLAKSINKRFNKYVPKLCHLYYIEAYSNSLSKAHSGE